MMTINGTDFEYIRELVRRSAAIVLDSDKQYLVESRLGPVAAREGLQSLGQLVAQLRLNPGGPLVTKVIDAMTTNETSFFRDVHPFETLRKAVIPDLVARRLQSRRLALWSAACSTGQEPYTIAIILNEHFPALLRDWKITLLATDLCGEVLERARAGRFSQLEINRGLPAPYMVKYFTRTGHEWQAKDELRQRITFQPINLARPFVDIPPMDIVFIRNVLIYFNQETKRDILRRVRRVLAPDGALFVGSSESPVHFDDGFDPVTFEKSVYFRMREPAPLFSIPPVAPPRSGGGL